MPASFDAKLARRYLARTVIYAAAVLLMVAAAPATQADEQGDNPQYTAWANFKVGSTCTLVGKAQAGPVELEIKTKSTLSEVSKDHVTLDTTRSTVLSGEKRPTETIKQTIPAKIEKRDLKDDGTEVIAAAGKNFKCEVIEVTTEAPNPDAPSNKGNAKAWISSEVPGGVVKIVATGSVIGPDGQRNELTLVLDSFEVK
jgi:hypothetical protein